MILHLGALRRVLNYGVFEGPPRLEDELWRTNCGGEGAEEGRREGATEEEQKAKDTMVNR